MKKLLILVIFMTISVINMAGEKHADTVQYVNVEKNDTISKNLSVTMTTWIEKGTYWKNDAEDHQKPKNCKK